MPWVALVMIAHPDGEERCTGSLIRGDWVVTAAHCFFHRDRRTGRHVRTEARAVRVRSGELVRFGGDGWRRAAEVIVHERYDRGGPIDHDIALVRLAPTSEPSSGGAALPWGEQSVPAGQTLEVAGFGFTEDGGLPDRLMRGEVVALEPSECARRLDQEGFAYADPRNVLCAAPGRSSTCYGDSGGPLMRPGLHPPALAGVSMMGLVGVRGDVRDCLSETLPVYFTRIDRYVAWIEDRTAR